MKNRKVLFVFVLLLLMVILITGCKSTSTETNEEELREFTIEELAAFNGKNGNPAYVAVDGIVYDVSDLSPWKNGDHNGFEAGNDLTNEIKSLSPHGVSKLKNVKKVGRLVE